MPERTYLKQNSNVLFTRTAYGIGIKQNEINVLSKIIK